MSIDTPGLAGSWHQTYDDQDNSSEAVLVRACIKAEKVLLGNVFALGVLEDYHQDAKAGRLSRERLRGFLQGLFAAGAMPLEDYDDLDRDLN
ncbi:hypothetical protein [Pseudomonas syringae]|uniref:hypothetical protein n=1 Tax=Pseudomonas syringae TaxID=317 RepID=UPI000BB62E74|nr:hypothetical protein [Pseudomonas syringae]PBQ13273.1 hypothetical protein CCL23_00560 [Pseudomonas syringae]POP72874.1 hypothetical protein CXB37_25275 [Pseudomonas syringae pv. syringae]